MKLSHFVTVFNMKIFYEKPRYYINNNGFINYNILLNIIICVITIIVIVYS
jgi:hypothetical protein